MSMKTEFHLSYHKLAKVLDTIPNGYPAVEDQTHLKILEKIFEVEEAEITSKLTLMGERVEKIAKKVKKTEQEVEEKLEIMVKKGQIRVAKGKKGKKYGLMPFVVGIYEAQLHRLDKELAELVEEYFNQIKGKEIFEKKPALHRIIPVNTRIETKLKIHTPNEAQEMINKAKSWGVRECICKKQQELINKKCSYPVDVCIVFSKKEKAYEKSEETRPVTKEEALKILKEAGEAGLIHSTMNVKETIGYICNCCTCCCGVLHGLIKWNQPNAMVHSNYIIEIETEKCIGCEECIEKCKFGALVIEEGKCTIKKEKCVGCGVCTLSCPTEALYLIEREKKEKGETPKNITTWMGKRAIRRKKNIFKIL